MQVNGHVKRSRSLPEYGVFIQVKILAVGLTVDHRSLKPELMDRALEFLGSLRRILHGQMSKSPVTRRTLLYFPGEKIVHCLGPLHGNSCVSFCLNAGARNRQNLEVNSMLIHNRDAPVTKIQKSLGSELRNLRAYVLVGFSQVVNKFGNNEVFFEPDRR
jgi:hypothetical protein